MVEDSRVVAERRLAEEEQERREARIAELAEEEERRREKEGRRLALEAEQAAARDEEARVAEEKRGVAGEIEEVVPGLRRLAEKYFQLDVRQRALRGKAGMAVPTGSAKSDVGGYLAGEIGDLVSAIDPWREAGSPGLAARDPLCKD